jgi:hypothetical protein
MRSRCWPPTWRLGIVENADKPADCGSKGEGDTVKR